MTFMDLFWTKKDSFKKAGSVIFEDLQLSSYMSNFIKLYAFVTEKRWLLMDGPTNKGESIGSYLLTLNDLLLNHLTILIVFGSRNLLQG